MVVLLALLAATQPAWACDGPFVPPPGYEQETAFSKDGEGAAADAARAKLSQRICQATACADLASRVAVWQAGHGAPGYCAMAVVERALVEEWRQSLSARTLHRQIAEALRPLVGAPGKTRKRIAVIEVNAASGDAAIATWLRVQAAEALGTLEGVAVVDGAANKIDTTIHVTTAERAEAQRAMLDVSFELKSLDGTLRAATVSVPRAAVPWTPTPSARPEKALALTVASSCQRRTEASVGDVTSRGFNRAAVKASGAFADVVCGDAPLTRGDRYRLSLSVSEPAFAYVIAYNSLGQFQVLFPFPDEDNALRENVPFTFPPEDWLTLDEHGGTTEHVIVVAARERQSQLELMRGVDIDPKGKASVDERPAATRSFLGAVTSRGFDRRKPTAKGDVKSGAALLQQVQEGPGIAAVELTVAHR